MDNDLAFIRSDRAWIRYAIVSHFRREPDGGHLIFSVGRQQPLPGNHSFPRVLPADND